MTAGPSLFRVVVEVGDLPAAAEFYARLLGIAGRPQPGDRVYFDCGPVILSVQHRDPPQLTPKSLYFQIDDLPAAHARAAALGCLSTEEVHGEPAGEIRDRPWGERSFYVADPWGNPVCLVAPGTAFTGR